MDPKTSFIAECRELLNKTSAQTGTVATIFHRLSEAIDRLEAVQRQANAQFNCGDRHATFNRNFMENLDSPIKH